jgi:MSHA biogenesis protein MshI
VVLDKLKTYFRSLSQWKDFFFHTKSSMIATDRMCCLDIDSKSFSIAYARYENGKINLMSCSTYPYTTSEDLQDSLTTIVKYHKLETVSCSWILHPDQYQLLLVDALPVPASEFQAAIRWKIKDLLRFPIDDVVIDRFSLPIKKASTGQDMIMVVAAKLSDLKPMSELLQRSGLNLHKISVLELSLLTIASLFDKEDKVTAFIYMQENNSQLIITSKNELHFARRIEWGVGFIELLQTTTLEKSEITKKIDQLALEVQRSFDYYQSQWRQPMPSRILFSAVRSISVDVASLLSQNLSIPAEVLNITNYFNNTKVISIEEQGKYLPILGGLFQHEGNGHVATN